MSQISLAFQHHNLRWNPFGEPAFEDLAALAVVEVEQYVERLRQPGFAVQYLGESGRGKSTHILALHAFFPDMPIVRFREGERPPVIPKAPILFLDETQRLPRAARRRVFSRRASFVIGTHEDHSTELKRFGVHCESVVLRGLTLERLGKIIQRRMEWARRGPGPLPTYSRAEVSSMINQYGDDIAAILKQLYGEFQAPKGGATDGNPG